MTKLYFKCKLEKNQLKIINALNSKNDTTTYISITIFLTF